MDKHLDRKNIASSSRLLFASVSVSRLEKESEAQRGCKPVEFSPVWLRFRCLRFLIGEKSERALKSFSFSLEPLWILGWVNRKIN